MKEVDVSTKIQHKLMHVKDHITCTEKMASYYYKNINIDFILFSRSLSFPLTRCRKTKLIFLHPPIDDSTTTNIEAVLELLGL
jgi:hypothetical protein